MPIFLSCIVLLEYNLVEQILDPNFCVAFKIEFSASNGREVELYSSMIFSIEVKVKSKFKNFISGGRYDHLTTNLGFKKVSAVGAAVNLNLYD